VSPTGIQRPRIQIVVGGNGQEVTWRLAARFADELNRASAVGVELVGMNLWADLRVWGQAAVDV
jgi:alkanesulfonate monooxygenase SsuD/methylene tetrahydromethanopterin reductase-like flavin-dependent oxidoreductase (luciferase family)